MASWPSSWLAGWLAPHHHTTTPLASASPSARVSLATLPQHTPLLCFPASARPGPSVRLVCPGCHPVTSIRPCPPADNSPGPVRLSTTLPRNVRLTQCRRGSSTAWLLLQDQCITNSGCGVAWANKKTRVS